MESGQRIIFYFVFVIAYASTIHAAASIPSKPLSDCVKKSAGLTGVGGPLCYCTGGWWSQTCYYCRKGEYKCYMCPDNVHCCYDDVPTCCLSSGICCPADNNCCGTGCCSESDVCCSATSSCCPENKPVCCEDPEHCCEEDTTCCGENCCTDEQKCCTDNENNKYCCGKDSDCCGNQCCKENTECCEVLVEGGGSKNSCLTYQNVETPMPFQDQNGHESLTEEIFLSLGGNGKLVILAVAVGQGDCTILFCPNNNDIVIVDMGASPGGQYTTAAAINTFLTAYFNKYPNAKMYNLVTHPNQDHFNYFPTAINNLANHVNAFVLGGVSQPSSYGWFGTWLLQSSFNNRIYVINNGNPCYGNGQCSIKLSKGSAQLDPQLCGNPSNNPSFTIMASNLGSTINSKSTVLKVEYQGQSVLLPGDFETELAQDLIVKQYGTGLQSTYYKIAHHGASRFANYDIFLEAINPRAAFVSQMYPSEFRCHHPRRETIVRLQNVMNNNPGGRTIPKNKVSPFVYWNTEEGEMQRNTRFCYPIYATCRQSGTCQHIIIQIPSIGINIRYIDVFPPVVAAEPGVADVGTIDCEDNGYDGEAIEMSKNDHEAEQQPALHQEL